VANDDDTTVMGAILAAESEPEGADAVAGESAPAAAPAPPPLPISAGEETLVWGLAMAGDLANGGLDEIAQILGQSNDPTARAERASIVADEVVRQLRARRGSAGG